MLGNVPKSQPQLPWHRRVLYGLTNWGLFASGAVNLAVGTWFAAHNQVAVAATSLTAGLVLLFAATIDRFESLKGLGIEARTRQLDQKIEQADDALRRLKELAELTGAALVDLNSKTGRWSSAPTPREAYALAQKVRSIMTALGSDPGDVQAALIPWVRITCQDIASAVAEPIKTAILEKITELERQRSTIPQPVDPNNPEFARITASIKDGNTYLEQRLLTLHQLEADDYPDRFLQLFDDVPLVDPQILVSVQSKARKFAADMLSLRQAHQLHDPEPWFSEIEEHRKR